MKFIISHNQKYVYVTCSDAPTCCESIEIPKLHENLPVTTIGSYAFSSMRKLKEVKLPDSIELIMEGAFFNCPQLKSITIPKSVTMIQKHAFGYRNNGLKTKSFKIYGYKNTIAEIYAQCSGFEFVVLEEKEEALQPLAIEDLQEMVNKPVFVLDIRITPKSSWDILVEMRLGGEVRLLSGTGINKIQLNNTHFLFSRELTEEEIQLFSDNEKSKSNTKKTGYERVSPGELYWTQKRATACTEVQDKISDEHYREADYLSDAALSAHLERADTLRAQLRRYAATHGGIPSAYEWKSTEVDYCYHIYYEAMMRELRVSNSGVERNFGQVYFKSKWACEDALKLFEEELIWYFNEYQEMLY
jgi:hypothetical protein